MDVILSLDTETIPPKNNEDLERFLESERQGVMNHGVYKLATKKKKIAELENAMILYKSGEIESPAVKKMIKGMSVNPFLNKIVAIGMVWEDIDGNKVKKSICSKDEKEVMEWFIETLVEVQGFGRNVIYGQHNIDFDLDSIRFSMIRHGLGQKLRDKCLMEDGNVLPIKKYSRNKIDTSQKWRNTKMDEIVSAALGKNKIMDGSEVYGHYMNDELDKIEKYVLSDADLWYESWKKINI